MLRAASAAVIIQGYKQTAECAVDAIISIPANIGPMHAVHDTESNAPNKNERIYVVGRFGFILTTENSQPKSIAMPNIIIIAPAA